MTDEEWLQAYEIAARIAMVRKKPGARRLPGTTRADLLQAVADPTVKSLATLAKTLGCSISTVHNRILADDSGELRSAVTNALRANREAARAEAKAR